MSPLWACKCAHRTGKPGPCGGCERCGLLEVIQQANHAMKKEAALRSALVPAGEQMK